MVDVVRGYRDPENVGVIIYPYIYLKIKGIDVK